MNKCERYLHQYFAVLSGTVAVISIGIQSGWTSPYLPKMLQTNSTEIHITSDQGSWIAVINLCSAGLGSILVVPLLDRIGRKNSLLLWTPFMASSFVIIAFAKSILVIYIARFIGGCAQGAIYTVLPLYVAEISEPNLRGTLSAILTVGYRSGILFINSIGPYTSIFVSSLIIATFPLVHFITFIFMPESPYYYLKKHMKTQAENSLKKFRGSEQVQNELYELDVAVRRQEGEKTAKVFDLFKNSNLKAVIIFVVITLTANFSGKEPFQYYANTIFSAVKIDLDANIVTIIYCVIEIVTNVLLVAIIDRVGRRILIITSTVGCIITLGFEGLYFYLLKYHESYVENLGWWPILTLIIFSFMFTLGLAFGPELLLSELFPTNIKATAACFGELFWLATAAIPTKLFQVMADNYGTFMPFWSYMFCCLILLPLVIKLMPETRGKSLEDIQLQLDNKTIKS